MQHEVRHLLGQIQGARMADADAQAPEVGTAQHCLNILQAIVAGMAAALLELHLARQQVQFVMQHQHLLGLQLVEAGQRADRLAGFVHIDFSSAKEVRRASARWAASQKPALCRVVS
ncbi:hypothetical protein G6F68_018753 [Rhizopus microsporus]|nr:hypothetical protein G6F68_018753 [Rhizopus microsporus]